MTKYLYIFLLALINLRCNKCQLASQYVVPMYLSMNPTPSVKLNRDTLTIIASVPYSTADLRLPGYPVSLEPFKPSELFFGLAACPTKDGFPIPPIDPFDSGLMELQPVLGRQINKNLFFEFAHTDTAWVIIFKLIPKKAFDGLFFLSTAPIQYKDECIQIDPAVVLFNTPQSHNLISERLDWKLSPYPDDVFFYVE